MRWWPLVLVLTSCGRDAYSVEYVREAVALVRYEMDHSGVTTDGRRVVTVMQGRLAPAYLGETTVLDRGAFASIVVTDATRDYVLMHELGHAMGLVHVDDPSNVMFHAAPELDIVEAARQLAALCSQTTCVALSVAD